MNEIIDWLIGIEDAAYKAYKKAASQFSDDRDFSDFLRYLSEDEQEHYHYICEAKEYLGKNPDYPSHIFLDKDTKKKIEAPLIECKEKIDHGVIMKEEMIDYIVAIEYSEVNHFFLYVVGTVHSFSNRHFDLVQSIKYHHTHIEDFIGKQPESDKWLKRIRHLPKRTSKKTLVVDDNENIVTLLRAILKDICIVDGVSNGDEALRKINNKYYEAIISDVNMQAMNGIELYNVVIDSFPVIVKERFLFFMTPTDLGLLSFFEENGITCLMKPAPINGLRQAVMHIMAR